MDVTFRGSSLPAFAVGRSAYNNQIFGASSLQSSQSITTSKTIDLKAVDDAADVDVKSRRDNSGVRGILSSIKRVTGRLDEINQTLGATGLSEDQRSALEGEKAALAGEYDRIVGGRDYQRFLEVSKSVQGLLASGGDPKMIFKSLQSERSILGEDYLNLVNSYATSNIGNINNALSQISTVTGSSLLADPSAVSRVASLASSADEALNIPRLSESTPVVQIEEKVTEVKQAPQQSELQFVMSNEIAMSLQGYSGKDLLNAAISGIDPKNASYLILHPPRDLDEQEATLGAQSDLTKLESA